MPTVVDSAYRFREAGQLEWPKWCFLPMAAWAALIVPKAGDQSNLVAKMMRLGEIAALGAWRYSRGIYRFDETVLNALKETPITGDLPSDVFYHLPDWCVFIETPGFAFFGQEVGGFFAHLEWDANTKETELRLLLVLADGKMIPIPIHLHEGSLDESLRKAQEVAGKNLQTLFTSPGERVPEVQMPKLSEKMADELPPFISLLLYLCSDEPEVDNLRTPGTSPKRTAPVKTKKGWKLFPPDKDYVWDVGTKLGKKLRTDGVDRAESEPTGRHVRTHIRRGHWHGFWLGPRTGVRTFKYHWLPPMVINAGD